MISFFVPIDPPRATHHSKVIVNTGKHSRLVDSAGLTESRAIQRILFKRFAPKTPMTGPLALTLEYTFPYLAKHSQKVRDNGTIYKTTSPDADNLSKVTTDILTELGFIANDALVCDLRVCKYHGKVPGISVMILEAEPLHGKDRESHEN